MTLGAGDSLGKYLIAGTLGRGAMGTVYDARDPVIDRRVAIKTIPLVPADDDEGEALARFKREAQAAGRLHHANIVGVYDYGETESIAYIIMEFVEGRSLKASLDAQERFVPAETARIMEGILAGLQYSHDRGVVHRDIKPANIMLTKEGVVKIADFGIARIESSQMTQAGTVMGTPAYMSPEQFMGQTVDQRTDIYSAGVLLYQLLTGERPFDGGMSAIMHKALHTEPPAPSAISVVAPAGFDAVVARAMAKRPEHRYQTADAFAAAIRAAMTTPGPARANDALAETEATIVYARRTAGEPAAPAPAPTAPKRRRRATNLPALAGIAAVLLALAGAGAFFALRQSGPASVQAVLPPPPAPPAVRSPPAASPPVIPSAVREAAKAADPAQLPALAGALSHAACSLAVAGVSHDAFAVGGVVSDAGEAALKGAAVASVPGAPIDWHLSVFTGPYCGVLDAVRPAGLHTSGAGDLMLALQGSPDYLVKDAFIEPQLVLPGFAAYLTVDYFSGDGSVLHIAPIGRAHQSAYDSNASVTFGANPAARQYPVSPPFGTDMIVATASSKPLFKRPRAETEPAASYLPLLRAALAAAEQSGAKIEARALLVETRAK